MKEVKNQGQGVVKAKDKPFASPKTIPMEVGLYRFNEVKPGSPLNQLRSSKDKSGMTGDTAKVS